MMWSRRRFLGAALAGMTGGAGWAAGASETNTLEVERVRVPVAGLPDALEGLRVVALSDFHLYPFTQLSFLQRALDCAHALKPDLMVFLGDFVDERGDAIEELAPAMARVDARLGLWAVLGNHDVRCSAAAVRDGLRHQGIQVLENCAVHLPVGNAGLNLAGLVSAYQGNPDIRRALRGGRVGKGPTLVLAHEPDTVDEVAALGCVDLQLSGHSHGAQVRLLGLEWAALPKGGQKYPFGSYRVGGTFLHTSRGLGTTGLPLRLGSVPEVTEVTLVRADPLAVSAAPRGG